MPAMIKFAQSHEWIRLEDASPAAGSIATVGISSYAVEALTDLVFMQLPQVGRRLKAGESFGEIESVKAVSDLYAPVGGEVVEVNTGLPGSLETLASDPYEKGWVARIRIDDPKELDALMDRAAYDEMVRKQAH